MNITLLAKTNPLVVVNQTTAFSLVGVILLAGIFTVLLSFNALIFSSLLVAGFGLYGMYSLVRGDYVNWFSVVCFFCGAESILRHGLPVAYMFFFFYLVGSGIIFLFISSSKNFAIFSPTGLIFLLAVLHFIHLDLNELRFGIGKWGLIWSGLFFGMWISQSFRLNVSFYECIWFYILGALVVVFSFLLAPQYFAGRYWPTFDGTGPVAASTGLLLLILVQQLNYRQLFSLTNLLLGAVIVICIIALVMLGSRGTFLALSFATIAFLFTIRGLWKKVLLIFSVICLIFLVLYIDQSPIGDNVLSTRVEDAFAEDTREGRKFINAAVLLSFNEDPIIGKGTGSWRHFNNQYIAAVFDRRYSKSVIMTDAHNTSLHLLFEHGILGTAIFLTAAFLLVVRGYRLSQFTNIYLVSLVLFSLALGLSTMHKQASMFLPFFLASSVVWVKVKRIKEDRDL